MRGLTFSPPPVLIWVNAVRPLRPRSSVELRDVLCLG